MRILVTRLTKKAAAAAAGIALLSAVAAAPAVAGEVNGCSGAGYGNHCWLK